MRIRNEKNFRTFLSNFEIPIWAKAAAISGTGEVKLFSAVPRYLNGEWELPGGVSELIARNVMTEWPWSVAVVELEGGIEL